MSLHSHLDKNRFMLIVGKLEDLPFANDGFDAVVVSEVLEHLTPELTRSALQEIRRVLAPEGQIIGTVPCEENLADGVVVCPDAVRCFTKWGTFNRSVRSRCLPCCEPSFPTRQRFGHAAPSSQNSLCDMRGEQPGGILPGHPSRGWITSCLKAADLLPMEDRLLPPEHVVHDKGRRHDICMQVLPFQRREDLKKAIHLAQVKIGQQRVFSHSLDALRS